MIETKVYQLDLPAPSEQLLKEVNKYVQGANLKESTKEWLDDFHNGKLNTALHLFSTDEKITQLIKQQYADFFPDIDIIAVIGIMKNNSTSESACQPPHVDRYRSLAINYYIELGGNQVQTSFYDYEAPAENDFAPNFHYHDVNRIGYHIFDKNKWYAYNVSQCHSIENILGIRYFLSISPANNPSYKVDDLMSSKNIKGQLVELWNN